jgi:hypothetical protein
VDAQAFFYVAERFFFSERPDLVAVKERQVNHAMLMLAMVAATHWTGLACGKSMVVVKRITTPTTPAELIIRMSHD